MIWPLTNKSNRRRTRAEKNTKRASRRERKFVPMMERLESRWVPTLTIRVEQTGFAALTIADGDPPDTNLNVNAVNFIGNYGTFLLNITAAVSKSAADAAQNIGHIDLSDSNFTANNSGGTL